MSLPAFPAFEPARAKHAELLRGASCHRLVEQARSSTVHPCTEDRDRSS